MSRPAGLMPCKGPVLDTDVRHLIHVLAPTRENTDDHGPWHTQEANDEIAALLDRGFRVVSTATAPIETYWVLNLERVNRVRLVLITTLVREP